MAVALENPDDPDWFDKYADELFGYPFSSDDELTPEELFGDGHPDELRPLSDFDTFDDRDNYNSGGYID